MLALLGSEEPVLISVEGKLSVEDEDLGQHSLVVSRTDEPHNYTLQALSADKEQDDVDFGTVTSSLFLERVCEIKRATVFANLT
jgi:hypothetical protein